jgi:hypothetical protein
MGRLLGPRLEPLDAVVAGHQQIAAAGQPPGVERGATGEQADHLQARRQPAERVGDAGHRPRLGRIDHDRRQRAVEVGEQRGRAIGQRVQRGLQRAPVSHRR